MTKLVAGRRGRRNDLLLICAWLLSACAPEQAPPGPRPEPVVVYVADEIGDAMRAAFDRYSRETGVPVIDRRGAAARIVDDLIANRVTPPADLLLVRSVVDAWRAAEDGALRPLYSETVRGHLPQWALDADGFWFAIDAERLVIVHDGPSPGIADIDALADDAFAGKLCLSSSLQPLNRAAIALLIEAHGVRPAELVVRGWVRNLAQPVFASEARLAAAIGDGSCAIGLLSARMAEQADLDYREPATGYVDVTAIGIGRHARNPQGAAHLAEWLVLQTDLADVSGSASGNVGTVARFYDDAVRLAERARYD